MALVPLSAGSLLLLRDIDLIGDVFVLRDSVAVKARLPLLNSDSGKGVEDAVLSKQKQQPTE